MKKSIKIFGIIAAVLMIAIMATPAIMINTEIVEKTDIKIKEKEIRSVGDPPWPTNHCKFYGAAFCRDLIAGKLPKFVPL